MAQLEDEEEEDVRKSQGDERKQEAQGDGKDTAEENTLEKYMKMVLEARAEQQEKVPPLKSPTLRDTPSPSVSPCVFFFFQKPIREETHWSPEARTLSEEKDNR